MVEVVVTGVTGLVGGALFRRLVQEGVSVHGLSRTASGRGMYAVDLTESAAVRAFLLVHRPSVVYHAAALANVDYCEEAREEAWKANVFATRNLVEGCREIGALFVYVSTDYVFDGVHGPYTERDVPSPIGWYGMNKLEGEILAQSLAAHLIVRTTVVYGWEQQGKNFVMRVVSQLRRGEEVRVPADQFGTPTFVENFVTVVLQLVAKKQRGIFHVAGTVWCSRVDFALQVASVFSLPSQLVVPVETAQLSQAAKRPLRAGLLLHKAFSVLGHEVFLSPRQALLCMRESEVSSGRSNS